MTVSHVWRSLSVLFALVAVNFFTFRSSSADVAGCWITVEYNCGEMVVTDPCAGSCEFVGHECGTAWSMDPVKKLKAAASVQYPNEGVDRRLNSPPLPQQNCGLEWKCFCVQPSGGGIIGCESAEAGGNFINTVSTYWYKPSIAVGANCTGLIYVDVDIDPGVG